MKGLSGKRVEIPSMEEIMQERKRLSYRRRYKRVLKSTAYALVVVAAIAVLLATNLLPVLQVSGDSMNPTLQDQDILVLLKTDTLEKGDLCGFYWQNKLLLKRIISMWRSAMRSGWMMRQPGTSVLSRKKPIRIE